MDIITTATSVDEANRGATVAVLPVGSFEQHGAHLPLSTDTLIACLIAQRIAETHSLLVLPPITISCSHEHSQFSGTVSISSATLHAMINEIALDLERRGITQLVLVNAHGGNYVLSNVVQEANVNGPRMLLFPTRTDWEDARRDAGLLTQSHEDMHAGEAETSILLHALPALVRDGWSDADHHSPHRPDLLLLGLLPYAPQGVIGSPSHATAGKGHSLLEALSDAFNSHLKLLMEPRHVP